MEKGKQKMGERNPRGRGDPRPYKGEWSESFGEKSRSLTRKRREFGMTSEAGPSLQGLVWWGDQVLAAPAELAVALLDLKKVASSSRKSFQAGSSERRMWLALGSGTNWAPGISAARMRPSSGGAMRSRSEWKTMVGTEIVGRSGRTLMSSQARMVLTRFSGETEMIWRSLNQHWSSSLTFSGI